MVMRRTSSLLVFLVFIQSASHARTGMDTVAEILFQINNKSLPSPPNQCSPQLDQLSYEELAQKCAVSLCGKPENMKKYYITDENFDRYISKEVMDEFDKVEPKIKFILEAKKKEVESFIKALRKHLNESEKPFEVLNAKNDYQNNRMAKNIYDGHIQINIDTSKKPEEKMRLSLKNVSSKDPVFMAGLKDYARKRKVFIQTNLEESIRSGYLTVEEAKEKIRSLWQVFKKEYLDGTEKFREGLNFNEHDVENMKKFMQKLDSLDNVDLADVSSSLSYYLNRIKQTGEESQEESLCGEICRNGLKSWLQKNAKRMVESLDSKLKDPLLEERTVSLCKSSAGVAATDEYDRTRLLEHIPKVKKRLLDRVSKKYSLDTQRKFNHYLANTLEFVFDRSLFHRKKDGREVSNTISSIEEEYQYKREEGHDSYKGVPAEELFNNMFHFVGDGQNIWGKLAVCANNFEAIDISDQFFPGRAISTLPPGHLPKGVTNSAKDYVKISARSCNHPREGAFTLAHELGHTLSNAFYEGKLSKQSYAHYLKLRNCVTSKYKFGFFPTPL